MPIRLEFDAKGIAHLTVEGVLKLDEAFNSLRLLYKDERFKEPTRLVWDFRATRVELSSKDLDTWRHFVRENRTQGRGRAALVAGDDLSFGIGRMYEGWATNRPVEVQVFRDYDKALSWLEEEF